MSQPKLPTPEQLDRLVEAANAAGAEGIWLARGASSAGCWLAWPDTWPGDMPRIELAEPHELVILIRFPESDGGEPGIEHR